MLQRDIDRVSEMFHDQGFLEARVRTRRIEDEDTNTVAPRIPRRTRSAERSFLIYGATLPAEAEIEELQEAWHRNTFDQFLIEDLTGPRAPLPGRPQNELAQHRRRHTSSAPTPDTKRLRMNVTPGASVAGRENSLRGQ